MLDGPSLERITNQALASRRFEVAVHRRRRPQLERLPATPTRSTRSATPFPGSPTSSRRRLTATARAPLSTSGPSRADRASTRFPRWPAPRWTCAPRTAPKIDELAARSRPPWTGRCRLENQRAAGAKLDARVKEIGSRPAGRLPDDAPILEFLRAVDAHLGIRGRLDCASTDANIPLSLGLPGPVARRRRPGRRRPHPLGVVQPRRPRPRPQAHPAAGRAADEAGVGVGRA